MTKSFLHGGRLAWLPVLIVLFSTVALVVTDYAWRMVQAPLASVAICGGVFLIAGNIAILLAARRHQ